MARDRITLKPMGIICEKCGNIYTTTPKPYDDKGLWHVAGCPKCGFGAAFFTKKEHDDKSSCSGHEKS